MEPWRSGRRLVEDRRWIAAGGELELRKKKGGHKLREKCGRGEMGLGNVF